MLKNCVVLSFIFGQCRKIFKGTIIYLYSFKMVIADNQYYKKSFEERIDILNAPNTKFLCKTIVF